MFPFSRKLPRDLRNIQAAPGERNLLVNAMRHITLFGEEGMRRWELYARKMMPSVMPLLERQRFEHSMALWCDIYWVFCAQFSKFRVRRPAVVREIVCFLRWSLKESHSAEVIASAEYALGEHLFDRPEVRAHLYRFFERTDIERLEVPLRAWNKNAKYERCFRDFLRKGKPTIRRSRVSAARNGSPRRWAE